MRHPTVSFGAKTLKVHARKDGNGKQGRILVVVRFHEGLRQLQSAGFRALDAGEAVSRDDVGVSADANRDDSVVRGGARAVVIWPREIDGPQPPVTGLLRLQGTVPQQSLSLPPLAARPTTLPFSHLGAGALSAKSARTRVSDEPAYYAIASPPPRPKTSTCSRDQLAAAMWRAAGRNQWHGQIDPTHPTDRSTVWLPGVHPNR